MAAVAVLAALCLAGPSPALADMQADERTAAMLAEMLRAARRVVTTHQDLINDADIGEKNLTGDVVLAETLEDFRASAGFDPATLEAGSRDARLMAALEDSISEIVDEHQDTINAPGLGFKAFIPAVVGRLVSQRFNQKVGEVAVIRVTAPLELVRNRQARPDPWEATVIETKFESSGWPVGQPFSEITQVEGREAFRVLAPEYYSSGCLSCHGEPEGVLDVTGYPMEGGSLGQLGGAISITLFR
jgi:Protein of unknown function (DUF3365)